MATGKRTEAALLKCINATPAGKLADSILFEAIDAHSIRCVLAALNRGCSINAVRDGRSALAVAGQMGGSRTDLQIALALLERGADPSGPYVMVYCRVELLPELVKRGGRVDGNPPGEPNPLLYALAARRKEDKALALIEAGADLNTWDEAGTTPLIAAAQYARAKAFRAMLQRGADPTAVDGTGRSALRYAVEALAGGVLESERAAAKTIFLSLCDRLPAQPEDALLTVLASGDEPELRRMLDSGLDPNTTIAGTVGLAGIKPETFLEVAGGLLSLDVDQQDLDRRAGGSSLLMWAVRLEQAELVRLLLERGADPNARNADGVSAADLAARPGNSRIAEMMGTKGSFRDRRVSGKTYTPSLEAETRRDAGKSRADRLGADVEAALVWLRHEREYFTTPDAVLVTYLLENIVAGAWEAVSAEFVLEHPSESRAAAEATLRWGELFFFGEPAGRPDISEHSWMRAFKAVMASAGLLRRDQLLQRLGSWVTPEAPRGGRSPMYNEDYFIWPLLQIWAAYLRGEAEDPAYARIIEEESARFPKLLLNAWRAMLAEDEKLYLRALGKCVTAHQKKAIQKGTAIAGWVLSAPICFIASEARRRDLGRSMPPQLDDWLLSGLPDPD